ncbi:MAG: VWA domain-containing protein [Myxococcaceae bacterium]
MTENPFRFGFLGYPLGLAHPGYLLLALLALLLGLAGLFVALRRNATVQALLGPRLGPLLAPGVSPLLSALQAALRAAALALFALALAQPQCGSRTELARRRGIDLVVAVDASKSMFARDVAPNRLERAKLELNSLLDSLKGDRVGIVAFAGDAYVQSPLTSDYAAAKLFLRAVDPEQMQQGGTNIGAALLLAQNMLESADRGAKDRVVVLLSDGEDLSGEEMEAAESLRAAGIKVYAVGIGSDAGEPIPEFGKSGEVVGYKKDASGNTVLTRLDRAGLEAVAQLTGGEFFYQPHGVAVQEVASRIDRLQKSELESRLTVRWDERFQSLLAPGLLLLAVALLLPGRRRGPT